MYKQLHKNFTDKQVKLLLKSYADKEIKINYIFLILGIKRCRFFKLLNGYKKDTNNFLSRIAEERLIERLIKLSLNPNK